MIVPAVDFGRSHVSCGVVCDDRALECLEVDASGLGSSFPAIANSLRSAAVMGSPDRILPAMADYVGRHAWTPWGKVELRAAMLGNTAGLIGAVPLFLESWNE